jgi:hypothetical protein
MKTIHQIAIKYLTYLVLNTRNSIINKNQYPPPTHTHSKYSRYQYKVLLIHLISYIFPNKSPPCTRGFLSMVGPTGSIPRRIARRWFFFSFEVKPQLFFSPISWNYHYYYCMPGLTLARFGKILPKPKGVLQPRVSGRIPSV